MYHITVIRVIILCGVVSYEKALLIFFHLFLELLAWTSYLWLS